MKLTIFFICTFGFGIMLAVCEEKANANTQIVTGARTWRMADGTTKRLRFTGFSKNPKYGMFQSVNPAAGGMAFSDFAKEEQATFAAFKNGIFKLAVILGLNMQPNFPTGKLPSWMIEDPIYWFGEMRTWENSKGKKIEARLACLTDEDVSLLIGGNASRVPMKDLGEADMNYLQELKLGKRRTYPNKVTFGVRGWDGGKTHCMSVSGEQYVALAQQGSNFDEALCSSLAHVKPQLESNKLDLSCFTETQLSLPSQPRLSNTNNDIPKDEKRPFLYVAEFVIKKSAEAETRRTWPLQTSPQSWAGTPELLIYVTADGAVLETKEFVR